MSDEKVKKKPGPEPDRLVIEEDPETALDKLVRKAPPDAGPAKNKKD